MEAQQVVEQTGETYPKVYDKPLSREHALEIACLKDRYVNEDSTPLVTFEDEHTVTLRVPEVIRRVVKERAS